MVRRTPGSQQARASKFFFTVCATQSSRGEALDNGASKEATSAFCPYVLEPTSEPCPCGNKGRLVFSSQWRLQADIQETDSKISI